MILMMVMIIRMIMIQDRPQTEPGTTPDSPWPWVLWPYITLVDLTWRKFIGFVWFMVYGNYDLYDLWSICHAWVCLRPQKRSRQKIFEDVLHCFSLNRFLAQLHPPNDTILVLYLAWPYLILPELSWLYKTTFRNLCFWGSEGRGARRKGPGARAARLALETPRVIDFPEKQNERNLLMVF